MHSAFILSLTSQEVQAIVQMLYMRDLELPESKTIKNAIKSLRDQTNLVNNSPKLHGIYADPLTAPSRAVRFEGSFYVPIL